MSGHQSRQDGRGERAGDDDGLRSTSGAAGATRVGDNLSDDFFRDDGGGGFDDDDSEGGMDDGGGTVEGRPPPSKRLCGAAGEQPVPGKYGQARGRSDLPSAGALQRLPSSTGQKSAAGSPGSRAGKPAKAVLVSPHALSAWLGPPPTRKRGRPRKVHPISELLLPILQSSSQPAAAARAVSAVSKRLRSALAEGTWPLDAVAAALQNAVLACAAPRVTLEAAEEGQQGHGGEAKWGRRHRVEV